MWVNKDRVLSFSVCADGDLIVNVAEGHELVLNKTNANEVRISSTLSLNTDRKSEFSSSANVGDVMGDGTIYGGVSSVKNRPFFTVSPSFLKKMGKMKALEYIKSGEFHGHNDWELSNAAEIDDLHKNRSKGELASLLHRGRKYYWAVLQSGQVLSVNLDGSFAGQTMNSLYFIPIRYG